ncbi:MAG: hypothetical protein JWO86_6089 [Myxococcaceae bacterium]|nr:hypothetical protein [Myxococcaceae bacterium]
MRELPWVSGTLSIVRWALVGALGLSLVAHGAVAAYFFAPRGMTVAPGLDRDPPPQNAGETFELPAPETANTPLANASPSPDSNAAPAPIEFPDAPARPEPPSKAKAAARPSHQGRPSAGHAPPGQESAPGSTGSAALFGAVGDRSATNLATAFTRDFPQAASGDPIWQSAALGSAGEATVVMTLDDSGHIADVQILGTPSGPLAQGIRRTMTLIKGRPFVAKNKVTKLRVSAVVTPDTVHDGLHGDYFAIHGSFAEGEGVAWFALPTGRRIDMRVRMQ